MSENYNLINQVFFWIFTSFGKWQFGLFFYFSVVPRSSERLFLEACFNIPAVCGVQFHSDHIQRVPGRDGQSVIQTQHTYHHGLTAAQPEEETADPGKHHWATCQQSRQKGAMFPIILGENDPWVSDISQQNWIPRGSCGLDSKSSGTGSLTCIEVCLSNCLLNAANMKCTSSITQLLKWKNIR